MPPRLVPKTSSRLAAPPRFGTWLLMCSVLFSSSLSSRGVELMIDDGFHHLRNVPQQEWSHFPENPRGGGFKVSFDVPAELQRLTTLRLRQADVKQKWNVVLNDTVLGALDRDHNDLHKSFALGTGLLKASGNVLEISCESKVPDDVRIGEIKLSTTGALTLGATVTLKAVDENGEAIPCRFTIVHAESGSLALMKNHSDSTHAVRTGVIYSLLGTAKPDLYPGKYRIYAGRGFEYSVESAEVELAAGQATTLPTFTLKRQVPTEGLVACDPHLHTLEFAGHGDASLIERLVSLAGEGVELAISTEHNKHVDYTNEAKRIGASRWFTSVLGCEGDHVARSLQQLSHRPRFQGRRTQAAALGTDFSEHLPDSRRQSLHPQPRPRRAQRLHTAGS